MADRQFPYAREHIALLDWHAGKFTVDLWMPPQGIWARISPEHRHDTFESATSQIAGYTTDTKALMLMAHHRNMPR